jgi:hypothetical protein
MARIDKEKTKTLRVKVRIDETLYLRFMALCSGSGEGTTKSNMDGFARIFLTKGIRDAVNYHEWNQAQHRMDREVKEKREYEARHPAKAAKEDPCDLPERQRSLIWFFQDAGANQKMRLANRHILLRTYTGIQRRFHLPSVP